MGSAWWLALYGAGLSSLLAGWTIYKDTYRDRLKVSAFIGIVPTPVGGTMPQYLTFDVRNPGNQDHKITSLGARPRRAWINAIQELRWPKQKNYMLSPNHAHLPAVVKPRDGVRLMIPSPLSALPADIVCLFVHTADGREWYAPKSHVHAVRKAIQAAKSTRL